MWGVVARIAAAAVVVAAVQHHVSQIYEAWRSEQQEGHQETKLFPKRPDDVAGTDGEGSEGGGGRDETRARADREDAARATGSERGASGPSGGHRTYSTVAVGASSAPSAKRGSFSTAPVFPGTFAALGSAAPARSRQPGVFADARAVALALRAARRVAR
jgi:hypothetical protein